MAIQLFDLGPAKVDFSPLANLGQNFIKSYESSRKARREDEEDSYFNDLAKGILGGGSANVPIANSLAAVSTKAGGGAPTSLINSESGGNWRAQNDSVGAGGLKGHFGRLQFGQARLQEAAAAGAIPQGTTPQAFMASPELQKRAEAWHFGDIDNFIAQRGYDKLLGKTIGGVPATVEGMRAVAHLGGKGGLQKFIESEGRYNPADDNGTTLAMYFSRHRGSGSPSAEPVRVAQAAPQADLPANDASPAQGFVVSPGQSGALPAMPESSGPTAQQRATIAMLLRNRETRAAGIQMMTQLQKQRSFSAPFEWNGGTFQMGSDGEIKQVIAPRNPLDDEAKRVDIEAKRKEMSGKKLQSIKGEDGTLYSFDPATGEIKEQVKGGPKSEDTTSLRKEVQQLPSYKNIAQAAPIYKSMLETAGRDSKASDLNLVYGLGKIMDPTSVVREGEMVMVRNSAGLSENLIGAINSLNGGAALTPQTRQALMQEAHSRMMSYKQMFDQDAAQYDGIIQRRGMNREDILPNFGDFQPYQPAKKPEKTSADAVKPGTVAVPPQAARALQANPERAAEFDAKYGAGMAKRILGK